MNKYTNRVVFCNECQGVFFTYGVPDKCPMCDICNGEIKDVTGDPKYLNSYSTLTIDTQFEIDMKNMFKKANRLPNGDIIDKTKPVIIDSSDQLTIAAMEAIK